jgi:hypothetical protein
MAIATATLVTAVTNVCADGRTVLRELTNVTLAGQVSMRLQKIANQFEKIGELEIAVLCREPVKTFQLFIAAAQRQATWEEGKGMAYPQGQFGHILTGQIEAVEIAVERWAAVREK